MTGERKAAKTALQALLFPAEQGRWGSKSIARGQSPAKHTQAPQGHLCWCSSSHLFLPETPRPWDSAWGLQLFVWPELTLPSFLGCISWKEGPLPQTFSWHVFWKLARMLETQFWRWQRSSSRTHSSLWSPKVAWKLTGCYTQGELTSQLPASLFCTPWFFLQILGFKAFKPTEKLR